MLGMESCINHNACSANGKMQTIRTDFFGTTKHFELNV
jgi:hypothetical protein